MSQPQDYLAICAIYQDEATYLREWIAFEHAMGVERFYLYNDASTDNSRAVLDPVIRSGLVVHHDLHDLPGHAEAWEAQQPGYHQQAWAYTHCLENHRDAARWMAFIDLDEFLFSPTGRALPDVFAEYEQSPGVLVNRATYGTSGHATDPEGFLIENYVRRLDLSHKMSAKSVVQPARTRRMVNGHSFRYYEAAMAVDENHNEVRGWHTDPQTFDKLRINHYWTKSEEWSRRKRERPRWGFPRDRPWPYKPDEDLMRRTNEVHDPVLVAQAPAVRAEIERLWEGATRT